MKGIRKLFFGLILMTLFCVGFKVDAWATITTELAWTDDDGVPLSSFSWEDAKYLTGIMSVDPGDFPSSGESSAVYKFIIFDKEPTDSNYNYGDPLDPDYNEYTVSLDNNHSYTIKKGNRPEGDGTVSGPTSIPIIKIPKETVRTKVGGKIAGYFGSRDYYAIATNTNDPSEYYYDGNTITLVKVTGGAYLGGTTYLYKVCCDESDISNGYYMFTDDTNLGETQVFTSAVPPTNYELQTPNGWSDDYSNSTIATGYYLNKAVVTANTPTDIASSSDPGIILKENLAYTGGPASLNTVYVTNGKSISLSNFISSSSNSATPVCAALSSDAQGSAELNPPNGLEAINSITITGTNSSGIKRTDGLTITNVDESTSTADVVVYTDKPTLTKTSTSSSGSGTSYKFSIKMPYGVYYEDSSKPVQVKNLQEAVLVFSGKNDTYEKRVTLEKASDDNLTKTQDETITRKELTNIFRDICKEDHETVSVKAYAYVNGAKDKNIVSDEVTFDVYKITLDGSAGASYQVDDTDVSGYFYGISGSSYKVVARGTGSIDKNNSSSEFANITASNGTATISSYGVAGVRTLKAAFTTSNSSSMPPSSTRNPSTEGDDYDDVPKTGESKTDIWILWSVLFVSILGAGFMIWKRFGLVRAIAEADEEVAVAEHKEEVKAKKKEKEDKLKMLKDLRNL